MEILKLREHSELASEAAEWFHSKWDIPVEEYAGSIQECFDGQKALFRSGMLQSESADYWWYWGHRKRFLITARI